MKFAFASDLHLSNEEKEKWSIDVLEEFLLKCTEIGIELVFFGGDLFDDFNQIPFLLERFNNIIDNSGIKNFYFLPGNHDLMYSNSRKIEDFEFSKKVSIKSKVPFEIEKINNYEFLFIPFQRDLNNVRNMLKQQKESEKRIVFGHGSLIDFNYSNEEDNSFFEKSFFNYLEADFVFLGHIHKHIQSENIFYPGSMRLWRKGEEGKHGFLVFNGENENVEFISLKKGGEYIELKVIVEGENFDIESLKNVVNDLIKNTWIVFLLEGFVYESRQLDKVKNYLIENFGKDFRIEFEENNLINSNISLMHPLFNIFMDKWKEVYNNIVDEKEKEVYRLARTYFAKELAEFIQGNEK